MESLLLWLCENFWMVYLRQQYYRKGSVLIALYLSQARIIGKQRVLVMGCWGVENVQRSVYVY